MLSRLLELFRGETQNEEQIDPALAAAILMFEVVWADHDVDDAEVAAMTELLAKQFDLDEHRVAEIVAESRSSHEESVGVFPFTRVVNDNLSEQQKYQIIRSMWTIALVDNDLDALEEHTIRRVADLIYLPHARFIAAKKAAQDGVSG
ncbi:MAG: TerB family tellurite resistance protein [Pseudomonadaceae bacterium]|nr:TerB family tellurite resistance protein [Pseudomonadaceae bacterium]